MDPPGDPRVPSEPPWVPRAVRASGDSGKAAQEGSVLPGPGEQPAAAPCGMSFQGTHFTREQTGTAKLRGVPSGTQLEVGEPGWALGQAPKLVLCWRGRLCGQKPGSGVMRGNRPLPLGPRRTCLAWGFEGGCTSKSHVLSGRMTIGYGGGGDPHEAGRAPGWRLCVIRGSAGFSVGVPGGHGVPVWAQGVPATVKASPAESRAPVCCGQLWFFVWPRAQHRDSWPRRPGTARWGQCDPDMLMVPVGFLKGGSVGSPGRTPAPGRGRASWGWDPPRLPLLPWLFGGTGGLCLAARPAQK